MNSQERFLFDFPVQSITFEDKYYPESLRRISDAPKTLYFRGNINAENKCFAIVGTRKCSDYGKEIAFAIAKDLASAGLTIVSGMARGIDSWAHKGALAAVEGRPQQIFAEVCPLPTIAVLGTSLDEPSIYPQENLNLARQILEKGGCLISEYPSGTRGTVFTFPQRNRIIAAMSLGVLVVEAKIKSGASITAKYAGQYNKKLFSVPGSVHWQNSKGCHLLIKRGAKLTENANDILKELGLSSIFSKEKIAGNPEEQLILNVLNQGSLHIDKIIEQTKLAPQTVSSNLSIMEIQDKIKNLGGNVYAINR